MQDVDERQLAALRSAHATRQATAELKRRIAGGALSVSVILRDPPAVAGRCSVIEMLTSQPGWAPSKSRRLLARATIGEAKLIGELTARQREVLAVHLEHRSL